MSKFITMKELTELLNVSEASIRRHIKKGLPCIKVGGVYRFDLDEVIQYYKEVS